MSYKPIICKLNDDNFIEIMYNFVKNWYEIDISQKEKINFGNLFNIKISNKINELLNFFLGLNHSIIYGRKRYVYNGFNYIFKCWSKSQKIIFDKKLDILFLFQEDNQDFYYGIKHKDLMENNPHIYRIIKIRNDFEYYKDLNMVDFLAFHMCTNAAKIGIKSYRMIIDNNMEPKMKQFEKLFEYKKQFNSFTIYEKDNVIASIQNEKEGIKLKPILEINKWEKDDKETTDIITNIFNWNGWSDNNGRYKL